MTVRSLLILEDHTMISEYIASVVAPAGFEPVQAFSLAQAGSLLETRIFDLWLCDLHLPDGDGASLLDTRCSDARHRDTPAVALTADLDAESRMRLISAGFADALAKPCAPDDLLGTLARVLGDADKAAATAATGAGAATQDPITRLPVLDDDAGLRVCGDDAQTLAAMRRLLAAELPQVRSRIAALTAAGDMTGLDDEIHKLSASTAWCGAAQLAEACTTFRHDLRERSSTGPEPSAFLAALDRLAAVLPER